MVFLVACASSPKKEAAVARKLPFYVSADFTPYWIEKDDRTYDSIHQIPPFQFANQKGDTITEKTVAGKIYVANFFFTSCPGICKRLTTNLKLVQDSFPNEKELLLLSHSVTPEMDDQAKLQQYAMAFGVKGNRWHLLTGNREAVYTLARQAYFADEDLGMQKNSNDFLHTENMLLIDKHRRIRGVYKGTSVAEVNNLIADIRVLKMEE